jgi:hypothetical protein
VHARMTYPNWNTQREKMSRCSTAGPDPHLLALEIARRQTSASLVCRLANQLDSVGNWRLVVWP